MYLKHAKSLVDSSSSYVLNMPLIWRFRFDHHRSHLLKAAACGPRSGRPAARLNERPEGIADAQDTGTREQRTRGQGPRAPDPLTRGPQRTMDQDPGTRGPGQSYEGPPGQEPTLEKNTQGPPEQLHPKNRSLKQCPPPCTRKTMGYCSSKTKYKPPAIGVTCQSSESPLQVLPAASHIQP